MKVLQSFVLGGSKYYHKGSTINRSDLTDVQYEQAYKAGLIDPERANPPEGVEAPPEVAETVTEDLSENVEKKPEPKKRTKK